MVAAASPRRRVRSDAAATQALLLRTAERLFAERGVHAVSNRQIAEAAGQGSNSAVGYHIGTKADLVAAIIRTHAVPMDRLRTRMLDRAGTDPRALIAAVVLPLTRHLADLGTPSWYARCSAQILIDPVLRTVAIQAATSTPAMSRAMQALLAVVPPVAVPRVEMVGHLIVHTCAEHERDLAAGNAPPGSWPRTGRLLIDAIADLLTVRSIRP
ncbi:TetR/AcrR family transcriptional regulator [Paractinoplanes toevensis]|uniref:TetR family transcriptional regulator n=1 Tax=Paractinoplanes toevensis TaxID=571911 RepID=A0A919TGX8_9ACTN|nr:TetR/AcrR family transcriptional regulator [Actinoplanes toevensis]GIM95468.1 TetR family transcriptional regulator [Actinoplanes toevensis]